MNNATAALVREVREALAAASSAPWEGANPPDNCTETQAEYVRNTFRHPDAHASHCHTVWAPELSQERGRPVIIGYTGDGPTSYANRELIAHAPEWLAALCAALEDQVGQEAEA